jgi:Tfp pilus assembly major pilin PilA
MSPYVQNVVQRQQQDAARQAAIAGQAQQAQAARSGAFGGSGDYLMRSQAAGNLARQKGDIQAKGLQDAYAQALNQFNQEQQQRQNTNQLNEQSRQYGAGLGLQGLQTAMTGANTLNTIGQTQFGQNMDVNKLQNTYGGQQQNQMNTILGNQYQEWLNAQNQPYKQMGFMSDIIRGAPLSQMGSTIYGGQPSTVAQLAGVGLTAKGLGVFAKGGAVEDVAYRDKPAGLADLAIYNMG